MEFQNWISPDSLENLVDLLNKHMEETKGKNEDIGKYLNYAEDWRRTFLYEIDWAYYDIDEYVILSKRYWFIKWLFDNKKIDLEELEKELSWIWIYKNIWYYEWLLMLLSVQDNPIDFLISILK
jgi:hypothetical protein